MQPEVALAQKDDVYSYVKAASLALLAETRASELEVTKDDETQITGASKLEIHKKATVTELIDNPLRKL